MLDYASPPPPPPPLQTPRWLTRYMWRLAIVTGLMHMGLLRWEWDFRLGNVPISLHLKLLLVLVSFGFAALPYLIVMGFAAWCRRTQPWNWFLTGTSVSLLTMVCVGGLGSIVYRLISTPQTPERAAIFITVFWNQMVLLVLSLGILSLSKGILMYATEQRRVD